MLKKTDDLSESLEDIQNEIKDLKYVEVNDVEYEMEYFLRADWKFLALCVGIQAANAKHSRIWCMCPSDDWYNIGKSWSITDKAKGARTIQKIQELSKQKKRGAQKYGCARQPLFPSIPIDHVIPDILHLYLRICDALVNLLIMELRRIDKCKLQSLDRSTATHVTTYEKFYL